MRRIGLTLGVAALLCALFVSDAFALYKHERDGWVAGIAYGYGVSKIKSGPTLNRLESGWTQGATPRLGIGHMVGQHLLIGYEQCQWMEEQGFGESAIRGSLQTFGLELNWFPGNPNSAAGGIYLRGGAGLANARFALSPHAIQEGGGSSGSSGDSVHTEAHVDEGGTSYMLGVGYEFRIAKPFAIGADLTANYQTIHKELFDTNWFIPITVELNWYF